MAQCPVCGYQMTGERWRESRDRILPGAWGGQYRPENIRIICQLCNTLRAQAGHCIGALACARAVTGNARGGEAMIMQLWGFGTLAAAVDKRMVTPKRPQLGQVKRMPGSNYTGQYALLTEVYHDQDLSQIGSRVARDLARPPSRIEPATEGCW